MTTDPKPQKRLTDNDAIRRFRIEMLNQPCDDCEVRPGIHVHHRVFRSQGGNDVRDNFLWLCGQCHDKRHGIDSVWPG